MNYRILKAQPGQESTSPVLSEVQGMIVALEEIDKFDIIRCKCPPGRKPAKFANQVKTEASRKGLRVQTATHGEIITFIKG